MGFSAYNSIRIVFIIRPIKEFGFRFRLLEPDYYFAQQSSWLCIRRHVMRLFLINKPAFAFVPYPKENKMRRGEASHSQRI